MDRCEHSFAEPLTARTPSASEPSDAAHELFRVGRNCFALARAERVALLVDGESYFCNVMRAAERATHSIAILSWEFNSAMRLCFDEVPGGPPDRLGDFLNWLVRRRRGLHIYVLDWDFPLVFGTDREFRSLPFLGWRPRRRVHTAYDNTQPLTGSHHQKVVVIDDAMAFIGGLDLTVRRWDTCSHLAEEKHRMCAEMAYPPFHDVMMAVEGEPARQLGDLARQRWKAATGRRMRPASALPSPWPESLKADFFGVDVALSRTLPELPGRSGVSEVEALYLDMIASARQRIYIENQYFTAHRIGEALAARLRQPDGPEIVVVVRLFSHGWLEEHTMHVLRTRLIERLRAADTQGRFHIYYPHVDGLAEGLCIDLHSKLMIVDDEVLRVGSANFSNRSMGMDTECDAAIAARGDARIAAVIRDFRNRLLGEHLDVEPARVDEAVCHHGSLHQAIDVLGGRSRTLRRLDHLPEWSNAVVELAGLADPARPLAIEQLVDEISPERFMDPSTSAEDLHSHPLRRRMTYLAGFVAVLATLAVMWRYTPLAHWLDPGRVSDWARAFADRPWAPLVILLAYTPACLLMFPRPLITLAAIVAFGPQLGFVYAISGILIAAAASYVVGLTIPRRQVYKLGGKRLMHLADILRRRSLIAMSAVRLVPIAPFAVVGLAAAAIGVRLLPFMFGTLIGVLPGTLATTIFGDQIDVVLDDPSKINYGILAAAIVCVVLISFAVRRWLVKQQPRHPATPSTDHAHKQPR